ncbi:MAG TPA: BsuBI/PstI family type II restriction endonuclease [Thermoanaerobaculia bacterium]|nr:BsuBI/PstI family type II restriction endonuclease [Thermoanaerobaculia bacterium]HQN08963.1 BsuBI/PstI family type II restriction endonuclease [Thermoanaerobaculia bacterium]HQP87162.1 BsuBI/PstI family type II restriction endonuclease [Thermoanaerobaculia bacterium]
MGKLEDGKKILKALGLPPQQQTDIASYTLLALADVGKRVPWASADRRSMKIHAIKEWVGETYGKVYAENTRETFRRQVLHQLEQARVVDRNPDDPTLPVNSPRTHYALTADALAVVRAFGTSAFKAEAEKFGKSHGALLEMYRAARVGQRVAVVLASGKKLTLSPGEHNELQKAIVESFAPVFAPGARLLYLGDTAAKDLHVETGALEALKIPVTKHGKLPDVVLHMPEKGWLLLIEAVTSHGPVSPKRKKELELALKDCSLPRVYVSAFPDRDEYRRHMADIAWETEVWIADSPTHMIHYNGEKFLGPHAPY